MEKKTDQKQKPPKPSSTSTGGAAAAGVQQAAYGAGMAPNLPIFFPAGLNPQAAGGTAPPAPAGQAREITFLPGYHGLRLGGWFLPRTVPPHHFDEAFFDPEETLGVGAAVGLRLGIPATPAQVEAALRGMAYTVLPSGSHAFPMDVGYVVPEDPDVFRADATVQRRMLVARNNFSIPGLGGISWEQGSGSGLIPGVGSGFGVDGRGWESVGARLESSLQPFDDNMTATTEHLGLIPGIKSTPEGGEPDEEFEEMLLSSGTESVLKPEMTQHRLAVDEKWLNNYVSDMIVPFRTAGDTDASTTPAGGAGLQPNKRKRESERPTFVLRPRVSRGGRLVIDRIRVARSQLQRHLTASIPALDARVKLVERDRLRAWRQLMKYSAAKTNESATVGGLHVPIVRNGNKTTGIEAVLSADKLQLLTAYELHEGVGFEGCPTDTHALHVAAFRHYAESGSSNVMSSVATHQDIADHARNGLSNASATTVRCMRGTSTSLWAPSRFTRVGDEMLPLRQQTLQLLSSLPTAYAGDNRQITDDPSLGLPPDFDPFYDDAVSDIIRMRKDKSLVSTAYARDALLQHQVWDNGEDGPDAPPDLISLTLNDYENGFIEEEFGIDELDNIQENETPAASASKRGRKVDPPGPTAPPLSALAAIQNTELRHVGTDVRRALASFAAKSLPGLRNLFMEQPSNVPHVFAGGSVLESSSNAYVVPESYATAPSMDIDDIGTVTMPMHPRAHQDVLPWLQSKGVPTTIPDTDELPEVQDAAGSADVLALLSSIPRDKYGIPMLGAHSGMHDSKVPVVAPEGSTMSLPVASLTAQLGELLGFNTTQQHYNLAHASGLVPAAQVPTALSSVSQVVKHMMPNDDKFADLWKREHGSDDVDILVTAYDDTGPGHEVVSHVMQHCFDDVQLAPLLDQLDPEKGT
jgi:hypothetical protein